MIYAINYLVLARERRHKEFEDFLAIQDPAKPVPSRKTHPNRRVQPLPKHSMMASTASIVPGKGLDMDEEKIGSQRETSIYRTNNL